MPLIYRGSSTATGTTSVTISVPSGTADGDVLMLATLCDVSGTGSDYSITGGPAWAAVAQVGGVQFSGFTRRWSTGDPTSITFQPNISFGSPASEISAIMLAFRGPDLPVSAAGSDPGGGSPSSQITVDGPTAYGVSPPYLFVGVGGVVNFTDPQSSNLTGDSPLTNTVNQHTTHTWLATAFDQAASGSDRHFSGVNATDGGTGAWKRSSLTIMYPEDTDLPPPPATGRWRVSILTGHR